MIHAEHITERTRTQVAAAVNRIGARYDDIKRALFGAQDGE
jgi:hypothetical protein